MGSWPDLTDYHGAVQHPKQAFSDAALKEAVLEHDRFGMPKPATGGNAVVYKGAAQGETWAIRCFLRPISDHQERYDAISKHLRRACLPYGAEFAYLREGICIRQSWYPLVKMQWVDGDLLHRYIEKYLKDKQRLSDLRKRWLELSAQLEAADIAHGDLQHGNVLVKDGALLLVDYDGMWVPALRGRKATETGHRAYQHPKRKETDFGPQIDRFSSLLIYLSILAVETEPSLWDEFHTGDNLLFVKDDFGRPDTPVWKSLAGLGSSEIDTLLETLKEALKRGPSQVPELGNILKKEAKRKRSKGTPPPAPKPEVKSSLPAWMAPGSAKAALPLPALAPTLSLVWSRPGSRRVKRWNQEATPAKPAGKPSTLLGRMFSRWEEMLEEESGKSEEVEIKVPGMTSRIACLYAAPLGQSVAVVTQNGECGFWEVGGDRFKPCPGKVFGSDLAAMAEQSPIAVVASAHEANIWDVEKWIKTPCRFEPSAKFSAVALSGDGKKAALGHGRRVSIFDVGLRKVAVELPMLAERVTALRCSLDAECVLSGTQAGHVDLFQASAATKWAKVRMGSHRVMVRAVAVAPNKRLFASGDAEGNVMMVGSDQKRIFQTRLSKTSIDSLAFLGNEDLVLAVGSGDGTVRIVSVGEGRLLASFPVGPGGVSALAFAAAKPGLFVGTAEGQIAFIA